MIDTITACGMMKNKPFIYNGETYAEWISQEGSNSDSNTCMDKMFNELKDYWKIFYRLTVAQWYIRLRPGVKKNTRTVVKWYRYNIRVGSDPDMTVFTIYQIEAILRRYHTHNEWSNKVQNNLGQRIQRNLHNKISRWNGRTILRI